MTGDRPRDTYSPGIGISTTAEGNSTRSSLCGHASNTLRNRTGRPCDCAESEPAYSASPRASAVFASQASQRAVMMGSTPGSSTSVVSPTGGREGRAEESVG